MVGHHESLASERLVKGLFQLPEMPGRQRCRVGRAKSTVPRIGSAAGGRLPN